MTVDTVTALNKISDPPDDEKTYSIWLEMSDAIDFLRQNCHETEFVVYATNNTSFIHSVLVPLSLVSPPDYGDLSEWQCNPTSCWGINVQYSEPRDVWITPPLDRTGSRTLDAGEQLVFRRRFEGLHDKKGYFEVLQKFLHVFDLHFVEERASYCRLDQHGDLEEMIRVVEVPGKGDAFGASAIVINRELYGPNPIRHRSHVRFHALPKREI